MVNDSILAQLYAAEKAIIALWPFSENLRISAETIRKCEEKVEESKKNIKQCGIVDAISGILTLVFWGLYFFCFKDSWGFDIVMLTAACCAGLCFAVFVVAVIANTVSYKNGKKRLRRLKEEKKAARIRRDEEKQKLAAELSRAEKLMPTECNNPKYARKFISYLETEQASDIPQARNLFEEFLHRERLEELMRDQIQKAEEARRAAVAAEMAAHSAANAINQRR